MTHVILPLKPGSGSNKSSNGNSSSGSSSLNDNNSDSNHNNNSNSNSNNSSGSGSSSGGSLSALINLTFTKYYADTSYQPPVRREHSPYIKTDIAQIIIKKGFSPSASDVKPKGSLNGTLKQVFHLLLNRIQLVNPPLEFYIDS